MANRHIIRKQVFELKIPKQEGAFQLQSELKETFYSQILPVLDKQFSENFPSDKLVSVDKLEIDLGKIPRERFVEDLVKRVADELPSVSSSILQKSASVTGHKDRQIGKNKSNVDQRVPGEYIWETFKHFLLTGTLPWYATNKDLSDLQKEASALLGGEVDSHKRKVLLQLIAFPSVQKRLFLQFSQPFLQNVLNVVVGKKGKAVSELLNWVQYLSEKLSLSTDIQKELKAEVWKNTFDQMAIQKSLVPEKLVLESTGNLVKTIAKSSTTEKDLAVSSFEKETKAYARKANSDYLTSEVLQKVLRKFRKEFSKREGDNSIKETKASKPDKGFTVKGKNQNGNESDPNRSNETTSTPLKSAKKNEEDWFQKSKEHSTEDNANQVPQQQDEESAEEQSLAANKQLTNREQEKFQRLISENEKEGIYIENAGLVLVASFCPRLFDATGLVDNKKLTDHAKAVFLMQYLATGDVKPTEPQLALNKILCGLKPSDPIDASIELNAEELAEADNLLKAVINYWKVLKNTSIDGLRETFLQRDGKLSRIGEKKWLLQVEQKTLDILLNKLPWGYSMHKYSWMDEMLTVEWA